VTAFEKPIAATKATGRPVRVPDEVAAPFLSRPAD
jgi:hypothetical protein